MNADLETSWQTATVLTHVGSKQGTAEGGKLRTHYAIFTVANLFFCGYMDHLLRTDTGNYFLTLFLVVESVVSMLFTMVYFITSAKEILYKTTSYPVSPGSRFLFVLVSGLRRPLFIGLYLTNCFFFAVFYWENRLTALWAAVFFTLLILNLQLIVSLLALFHKKISFGGIAMTLLFASFILIASSVLFHEDFGLGGFPLIQWVVNGVAAARAGDVSKAMIDAEIMGGILVVLTAVGMKTDK